MQPPIRTLTRAERRALDAELLKLIELAGTPATLPELFAGLRPKWAEAAAERLAVLGLVREGAGERLELTAAGRDAVARQAPAAGV